tara:strand:- start:207 stop:473 length:267 start_codon:yes stop_codon:yes gene_type:complete
MRFPYDLKGSKMTRTNYEILGWSDDTGAMEMQVTADYRSAVDWVKDYTRWGDFGGWEEILIQNDDGEPIATLDAHGWTYYRETVLVSH